MTPSSFWETELKFLLQTKEFNWIELKFHHLKNRRPWACYGSLIPRIKFKRESPLSPPGLCQPTVPPGSLLCSQTSLSFLPASPPLWQMSSAGMSLLPCSHIPTANFYSSLRAQCKHHLSHEVFLSSPALPNTPLEPLQTPVTRGPTTQLPCVPLSTSTAWRFFGPIFALKHLC